VEMWREDQSPPAYYVLVWLLFQVVPPGAFSVRILSLFAHLAAVVLIHAYTRRYHGERVALVATYGLAVNATMVWFATCGRCFALLVPLSLAIVWAYRALRWTVFTVVSIVSIWIHYSVVPLLGLIWVWDVVIHRRVFGPATRAMILIGAGASPLVLHVLGPRIKTPELYQYFDLSTGFLMAKWWFGLDVLPPMAVLVGTILLGVAILLEARHYALEVWVAGAALSCSAAFSAFVYPAFHPKFVLWTLPFALICMASLLSGERLRAVAWAWIVIAALGTGRGGGYERSSDIQEAEALAAQISPRDRVLTSRMPPPKPYWRLEQFLRTLPRKGRATPSTWLLQGTPDAHGMPSLNHGYRVLRYEGVPATPPTSWVKYAPMETLLEPIPNN